MKVVNARRVEAFVQPLPVGPVEVLGGELRELDHAELGVDVLDLPPLTPRGGR